MQEQQRRYLVMSREPEADGYRYYNKWGGNPKGVREDITKCIEVVSGSERWDMPRQCSKKRGYGKDGLYCKVHDPEYVRAKEEKQKKRWDLERERDGFKYKSLKFYEALKKIADGDNDARRLAQLTIEGIRTPDEVNEELRRLK